MMEVVELKACVDLLHEVRFVYIFLLVPHFMIIPEGVLTHCACVIYGLIVSSKI